MSHYKSYPEYKESGAELIGNIPKDWELKRLRHVAIFNNSNVDKKSYDDQADVKLCNYTDVYYNEFITPDLEFMNATASESEIDKFRLAEGDVIITKDSEDPNDIGIPALVKQDMHDVVCGYHLTVIKSHEFDLSGFIHRSIQSHPTKAHFFVESPGITRFGLDQDAIGDIPICIPPKEHRSTIVSAINTEINRINTLITKKTRFIELLKEKRQSLITHAVTKGLNSDVKMKDSGIEWIEVMPKHWESGKLRWFTVRYTGGTPSKAIKEYWINGTIPWLNSGAVNQPLITEPSCLITEDAFNSSSAKWISKGALVMALAGQGKTKGMVAQLAFDTTCNQSMAAILPYGRLDVRYLFWWLQCNYINIRMMAGGDLRDGLNLEIIGDIKCPIPPTKEQKAIAEFVDRQTTQIDTLLTKTQKSIELLKERRSAFITAAVTGQIDLRGEPV